MNEAAKTLDGWYCLHDFRTINWSLWKQLPQDERQAAIDEVMALVDGWEANQSEQKGSYSLYSIVSQKADLMIFWLRPTMEELNALETAFNKTKLAEFMIPVYSYFSVVELSNYVAKSIAKSADHPKIQERLKPILPQTQYACFYPMDKRREGQDNWYMLSMEERRELMVSHGKIGRSYAGYVNQIIGGSIGFDDWEWAVTLFSDDLLQFKKIVYEMRFDEVSARYGDFGSFYVGHLVQQDQLPDYLSV